MFPTMVELENSSLYEQENIIMITDEEKGRFLQAVRDATATRESVQEEMKRLAAEARIARAKAISEADDAGVPRQEIAEAAGAKWPMTSQGWSALRQGKMGK